MADGLTLATVRRNVRVTLGPTRAPAVLARRLAELGLRPGAQVTVLLRTPGDGRVLAVANARLAVDRRTLLTLPVLSEGQAPA